LYHQAYPQFNDQSYSPQYQATPQQQSEAEPPPPMSSDFQDQMLKFMSKMDQIIDSQNQIMKSQQEKYTPQFFNKIEAHFEQIMNHLNREEEEFQNQPKTNLDGHYMVDESTSYHEQSITTMKNGEVIETHVEELKTGKW
jgi:hypothetical protein